MSVVERNQNSEGCASNVHSIARIRSRLAELRPERVGDPHVARAAVALVLAELEGETRLLLIRRATRDGDPWSGHIAFPGGRRNPDDADMAGTAIRETREEVGIDLAAHADLVAPLEELRAVAQHRPLDLVITPIVFALTAPVSLRLDAREVASAVWVPLSFFDGPDAASTYSRVYDGIESKYPCYSYQEYTIWGLTYRMVDSFLAAIRTPGA